MPLAPIPYRAVAQPPHARLAVADRNAVPLATATVTVAQAGGVAIFLRAADDTAVDCWVEPEDAERIGVLLRHGRGLHELEVGRLVLFVDEAPGVVASGVVVVRHPASTAVLFELPADPPMILTFSTAEGVSFGGRLTMVATAVRAGRGRPPGRAARLV